MSRFLILLLAVCLLACGPSGPQAALDHLAQALENNNPHEFIAGFDMDAYADNQIRNFTEGDQAMSVINSFGRILGFGNVDELVASLIDLKGNIEQRFTQGVASGELMAQCRTAITPDCPWTPGALRSARVVELGQDAAIAQVTTPAKITSWLGLRKQGGKWLIVGQAVLEARARTMVEPRQPTPQPQKGRSGSSQDAVNI